MSSTTTATTRNEAAAMNAQTLDATGTNSVSFQCRGGFVVQLGGTFTGTFVIEASPDGATWYDCHASLVNFGTLTSSAATFTAAAAVSWAGNPALTSVYIRVRCSIAGTGTVNVTFATDQ